MCFVGGTTVVDGHGGAGLVQPPRDSRAYPSRSARDESDPAVKSCVLV